MATFEHSNRSRAEMELNKIIEREAEQKRIAASDFQHLHKTGAEKFGALWLSCNLAVSSLRDLPYLSSTDKRIDALLSQCAWKMAEHTAEMEAKIKQLKADYAEMRSDLRALYNLEGAESGSDEDDTRQQILNKWK